METRTTEMNVHEKKYHVLFQATVWFAGSSMPAIHSMWLVQILNTAALYLNIR
jgi:hypothetical protein